MSLDKAKSWLNTLLPLAREAGPVLTLAMAVMLVISSWWFAGWLRECADRNRLLGERLVQQQERFHTEIMVHLSRCAQAPPR